MESGIALKAAAKSYVMLWSLGLLGFKQRLGMGSLVHTNRMDSKLDRYYGGSCREESELLGINEKLHY